MCCVGEIPSSLRGAPGKRQRASTGPVVVAIVSLLLVVNARALGLTINDLQPSHRYKLEKIDLSGEHVFSSSTLFSVIKTKERPWYQIWKPLPDFDPQAFKDD